MDMTGGPEYNSQAAGGAWARERPTGPLAQEIDMERRRFLVKGFTAARSAALLRST